MYNKIIKLKSKLLAHQSVFTKLVVKCRYTTCLQRRTNSGGLLKEAFLTDADPLLKDFLISMTVHSKKTCSYLTKLLRWNYKGFRYVNSTDE
jgi:hypothetical protein